jgi:hypothetical protein
MVRLCIGFILEVRSWIRVAFCQGASRSGGGMGAIVGVMLLVLSVTMIEKA